MVGTFARFAGSGRCAGVGAVRDAVEPCFDGRGDGEVRVGRAVAGTELDPFFVRDPDHVGAVIAAERGLAR